MAIRLIVNMGGATKVLTTLEGRLADMTPAMVQMKEVVLDSIRQNFEAGGRPTAWAPLKYRQGTPLTDTGFLRGSITGEVTATSVVVGTNVPYAAIHNYGGTIQIPEIVPKTGKALRWIGGDGQVHFAARTRAHPVVIPQREFMVLQDSDIPILGAILTEYLRRDLD